MSHYMTALAMRQQGLKPATKIVLYWLADHHNGETGLCCPSLNTLSAECEMNRSTVVRHLDKLEADGLIRRNQRERSNGSRTSTEYILELTPVAERNNPCCKTQQPPVAKCDPHNLGNNNLGSEPLDISDVNVFDVYNLIAENAGWPSVQSRSKSRERAATARVRDCGGFENWKEAMERAARSDFLLGKATGTTPASFDWLNKPANFTKLMEGNYDNRTNQSHTGPSNGAHGGNGRPGSGTADAFAAVAARMSQGQG